MLVTHSIFSTKRLTPKDVERISTASKIKLLEGKTNCTFYVPGIGKVVQRIFK